MKTLLLATIIASATLTGCSSTPTQYVALPDVSAPISDDKAIIELHRTSSIVGAAVGNDIYDNDSKIGIIRNDTKLLWERDANKVLCLTRDKLGDNTMDYFVNPLITAFAEPAHPECFKLQGGKINKFKLVLSEGRFIDEETWLKDYN